MESRVASAEFRLALPQMPRPVGGVLHFFFEINPIFHYII